MNLPLKSARLRVVPWSSLALNAGAGEPTNAPAFIVYVDAVQATRGTKRETATRAIQRLACMVRMVRVVRMVCMVVLLPFPLFFAFAPLRARCAAPQRATSV